jgi:hypothetical protein
VVPTLAEHTPNKDVPQIIEPIAHEVVAYEEPPVPVVAEGPITLKEGDSLKL